MPQFLIDGFKKFVSTQYSGENPLMPYLVAEGQNPDYFIVSCIDSRSHAGVIFGTPPGTFFSHKSMGAIVRPYKSGTALAAALQFALKYNKVKTIILLGHTSCGAVKALIDDIDDPEISSFIAVAKEGLQNAENDTSDKSIQRRAEEHILRLSRKNIEGYPSIAEALKEKRITIKSWIFDMHRATLCELDENTDEFKDIINDKGTHE